MKILKLGAIVFPLLLAMPTLPAMAQERLYHYLDSNQCESASQIEQEPKTYSACIGTLGLEQATSNPEPIALTQTAAPPVLYAQANATAKVTGTVTYLQRIALPPNAIVEVKLQEVSRLDAPAVTVAEQTIETEGRQVPFPFELSYDTSQIDPRYTYVIQARILVEGELRWISTTAHRVITQGNPSTVEVRIEPVRNSTSTESSSPDSSFPSTQRFSARYDCEAKVEPYKAVRSVSLEEAQRLQLQRDDNSFIYRCVPAAANEFRYNCRSQVVPYPDRSRVGLAEAERLLSQMDGPLFVYQCSPI